MVEGPPTSWTTIRAAGQGDGPSRERFARRYSPVIEAYLRARWRMGSMAADVGDAAQEVFLECFREGGALQRADRGRPGGFRAYLYGVTRNVAQRFEQRRRRTREALAPGLELDRLEAEDDTLSVVFDRAWAEAMLREAAQRQQTRARGDELVERRVELLRMRFQEELPIREIAIRWKVEPAWLHHEYARARDEFRQALIEVLSELHPGAPGAAEKEAEALIHLLG